MKFLNKIKSLFAKKTIKETDFNKEICEKTISRIKFRQSNLNDRPKNLTEEEWKKILNQILFAFSVKQQGISLKSLAKRKMRKKKVVEGFRLFEVYLKDL
jgi:hypothetical protein